MLAVGFRNACQHAGEKARALHVRAAFNLKVPSTSAGAQAEFMA
jgi:hypothetical protein